MKCGRQSKAGCTSNSTLERKSLEFIDNSTPYPIDLAEIIFRLRLEH